MLVGTACYGFKEIETAKIKTIDTGHRIFTQSRDQLKEKDGGATFFHTFNWA